MKILKTNDFVSERMKVKPITNVEWEQMKQDMSQKALEEDCLPLRQGDVVHVTYENRYYMVVTDVDLLHEFGLIALSADFEKGALMSYDTSSRDPLQCMKLINYSGVDFVKYDLIYHNANEFDITDVWRPNKNIMINRYVLNESNIKSAINAGQYRKIYERK